MSTQINTNDDLLRSFLPKEASHHDFEIFKHLCNRTGLDPVLKQIIPMPRRNKKPEGTWVTTITFQTSIDGYRLIAERTGKYSPGRESTYSYDKDGRLFSASSYIKKMTDDGTWHEVGATAIFSEYAQTKQDGTPTQFWSKMGHVMIAKCAEALALRKAFPAMYAKLYTEDEMEQAKNDDNKNEEETSSECKADLQPEVVTKIQAQELKYMLEECNSTYQNNFWNYLRNLVKGLQTLEDLPASQYDKIKTGILRNVNRDLAHA